MYIQGFYPHMAVHLIIYLLICFILYLKHKDWRLVAVVLLFGFTIDADHLLDYLIWNNLSFNFSEFFNTGLYYNEGQKIRVILHGWEYLLILWFVGKYLEKHIKIKGLTLAIMFAYFGHLFWDNISFLHHPFAYSIIFRIFNNFDANKFNAI